MFDHEFQRQDFAADRQETKNLRTLPDQGDMVNLDQQNLDKASLTKPPVDAAIGGSRVGLLGRDSTMWSGRVAGLVVERRQRLCRGVTETWASGAGVPVLVSWEYLRRQAEVGWSAVRWVRGLGGPVMVRMVGRCRLLVLERTRRGRVICGRRRLRV